MSKTRISAHMRTAVWRANACKCFYCGQPIPFRELEIDHLIAESTSAPRVADLVRELGLAPQFSVNDPQNLVPSHRYCNARKSDKEFRQRSLLFYLEIWAKSLPRIEAELTRLRRQSRNESLLVTLAARIEDGALTIPEVVGFLEQATNVHHGPTAEPLVVCFGLLDEDVDPDEIPHHVPLDYPAVCDWLEQVLLERISDGIPCLSVLAGSQRTGETLSVRVAFWNLDVQHLESVDFVPWQVLEIAYYSEIYPGGWEDLFPKAVVSTYHRVIRDTEDPMGIKRCPGCGAQDFDYAEVTDYNRDEVYRSITCKECGWSIIE